MMNIPSQPKGWSAMLAQSGDRTQKNRRVPKPRESLARNRLSPQAGRSRSGAVPKQVVWCAEKTPDVRPTVPGWVSKGQGARS